MLCSCFLDSTSAYTSSVLFISSFTPFLTVNIVSFVFCGMFSFNLKLSSKFLVASKSLIPPHLPNPVPKNPLYNVEPRVASQNLSHPVSNLHWAPGPVHLQSPVSCEKESYSFAHHQSDLIVLQVSLTLFLK